MIQKQTTRTREAKNNKCTNTCHFTASRCFGSADRTQQRTTNARTLAISQLFVVFWSVFDGRNKKQQMHERLLFHMHNPVGWDRLCLQRFAEPTLLKLLAISQSAPSRLLSFHIFSLFFPRPTRSVTKNKNCTTTCCFTAIHRFLVGRHRAQQ